MGPIAKLATKEDFDAMTLGMEYQSSHKAYMSGHDWLVDTMKNYFLF